MKIHKTGKQTFFPASAVVLLFAALCAYAGAWLYSSLSMGWVLAEVRPVTASSSISLNGIAVRREQSFCSLSREDGLHEDGCRLPAGSKLGMNPDGSPACSAASAVFCRGSDGFEYLAPEMLEGIGPDRLKMLVSRKPAKKDRHAPRLVYGSCWYYAAVADASLPMPAPGKCRIRFEGADRAIEARLLYVSPPQNGKAAVLIRICCGGKEFLDLRKCRAELIFSEYSGLMVPARSVRRDSDGNEFVYTLTAGRPESRAVEIIYSSGEMCIAALSSDADALREGDILIVSGIKKDGGEDF